MGKRLTNTPVRQAVSVLKCPDDSNGIRACCPFDGERAGANVVGERGPRTIYESFS
jgi:hypothetical protein